MFETNKVGLYRMLVAASPGIRALFEQKTFKIALVVLVGSMVVMGTGLGLYAKGEEDGAKICWGAAIALGIVAFVLVAVARLSLST